METSVTIQRFLHDQPLGGPAGLEYNAELFFERLLAEFLPKDAKLLTPPSAAGGPDALVSHGTSHLVVEIDVTPYPGILRSYVQAKVASMNSIYGQLVAGTVRTLLITNDEVPPEAEEWMNSENLYLFMFNLAEEVGQVRARLRSTIEALVS